MIDKKAAFANLVVKFGNRNLLDYKELFTAAIMVDTNIRKYGSSSYRFMDAKIKKLDPTDPLSVAMYGRFVKDTEYTREQVLLEGKLVADEGKMQVALSAFFCIFLADHRMAYVPETKNAPPLDAFGTTLERFLRQRFTKFIDQTYHAQKLLNPKFTRANAIEGQVSPVVHIVPLPAKQSIRDFVSRFEKINSMTVGLINRNSEMTGGIFQALISAIEPTGAETAKLVANGGEDGLDISATTTFVEETTQSGYENVTLRGVDTEGNKLKGGNEEFRLTADIPDTLNDSESAKYLFAKFKSLVMLGQISTGDRSEDENSRIRSALEAIVRAAE